MSDQQLSPADAAAQKELQQFIQVETQKFQFQQQVHSFTELCWDKCVGKMGNKLDRSEQDCLGNCVERFLDTRNLLLKRLETMSE